MERMSEIRNGLRVCLFIWIAFHLLSGCTETEVVDEPHLPKGGKEVQAVFNLNVLANRDSQTRSIAFMVDGTIDTDSIPLIRKDTAMTKAANPLPEAEESRIAQLWIGQYDVDGNWIFNQYFPIVTGTKVDVHLIESDNTSYHVWFVVNVGDLGKIDTEAVLKKRVLTYSSNEAGLPENQLCGMTGMWSGVVNEGGMESINVDLTRLVAKISFAYQIGGTDFSFTPTSVTLNSVPDRCQIEAPTGQLTTDVTYKTYSGTASKDGATMYWYLPENMAGTVSGENTVESEKKKTGQGVTHATYIELTGQAIQSGVTYENVTFRFYPGSGMNNYDIVRNSHYTMNVTLVGIDITDERITVGTIPPVDIGGLSVMPAGIGGTTELQITARPGQQWKIGLPDWLSALINGETEAALGSSITYQGPAKLLFKAGAANPQAERRSFTFPLNVTGEEQTVEIIQEGSTLESGSDISLGAVSGAEGRSAFKATKGLLWRAVLSDGSWLDWADTNPVIGGDAATGEDQSLIVKATGSNPYIRERTAKITVEAGASVGSADYHGLQKEISILQAGSTVQGSSRNVNPEAASNQTSSFVATSGLEWIASVTNGDWITLSGATSGNPTTGETQNITFNVSVNPSSSPRSGEISVRAGDETDGPSGKITVNQSASTFTVDKTEIELENTATSGSVKITGTAGLPWTVSPSVETSGITPGTTSETANGSAQTLTFNATENSGDAREATFTVAVTGGDHSQQIKVKQKNNLPRITLTIDQSVLTSYRKKTKDMAKYPPFDYDGSNKLPNGSSFDGSATMTGSYTIQIERDQGKGKVDYATTQNYCSSLAEDGLSGWRIPTQIELHAMYINKAKIEGATGVSPFISGSYWSSSVYSNTRCRVSFVSGVFNGPISAGTFYVRCVRDLTVVVEKTIREKHDN